MRKLKGERIMSNVRWTEEQESAITSRGRNLLLSAAAGSGKTAVLVERIIRMVCDVEHPVNITSLLVLTFTKAAAAEMRTRITDALTRVLENAEKEIALKMEQMEKLQKKIEELEKEFGGRLKK